MIKNNGHTGSSVLEHFTYGPIQPHEVAILQQMIQDTEFSSMRFNQQTAPVFMARTNSYSGVAGFAYGHKGYGSESHVLTLHGTYLRNHYDDEHHQSELQMEFIHWAEKALKVTHYKLNEYEQPRPINISYIAPPLPVPTVLESSALVPIEPEPAYVEERALAYG